VDPVWTLAALVGVPLLLLPVLLAQGYVRRKTAQARSEAGMRATRLDEVFHGIQPIKLNQIEDYQIGRFERIVDRIVGAEVRVTIGQTTVPAMIDITTGLGFFLVLLLGARDITDGSRTVGEFMSFFTAMALTFQPIRRLGDHAGLLQVAGASLERIFGLFDTAPAVRSPAQPVARPARADTAIRFDDVQLAYGDLPVLRSLSFTAEAGKTTALVGPSGAGKSTVFNLLTRMVDPQSGRISIGGVPVQDMALPELRGLFSVVTQDALLFDETIRENVLLGAEGVPEERLAAALEAARVTAFTAGFPGGIDTAAGPRGSALSGGQRQRVAIARALLRDAPILLLDEATSALDAASERQVQEALDRLAVGRTTLVIAHRLATVRQADRIVVLEAGTVTEEGTHDELIARGGTYASLCRLQFGAID
jgi:ATP-binding cassette subfamily B protein/subfamily B ATP-binding cassette protein MsbA